MVEQGETMVAIAVVLAHEELRDYVIKWANEFKSKYPRRAGEGKIYIYRGLEYLTGKFRSFLDEYGVQTMIVYKGAFPGKVKCVEIYSELDFEDFVLSDLGIPVKQLFE